ncbi:MAG: UDP-2,3-diacylglucosamine diphosphatase [Bacteroidetes bacterium]|nr:UDP-2,3-diacylglucosamine diphosphatase [Bacteroidota bacterium]
MNTKTNIYFASDFHLGAPNYEESLIREKRIVKWLDEISKDAKEIYLVGDIFDFWFEYRHAIPKGFVRLQGKIAELTDKGIDIFVFRGNHDMWIFDYIPKELGVKMIEGNVVKTFNGKKIFIGHGDGLGPGDYGYKMIKKIFANKLCQWAFARLHPNLGMGIANYWSHKSRKVNAGYDEQFLGEENEWLAIFAKDYLKKEHIDYFIFGHRHLPIEIKLNEKSSYINLGEWINYNSYAVFDGEKLLLKYYK